MDVHGRVPLAQLLPHLNVPRDVVYGWVSNDNKGRFAIEFVDGIETIRACQGHTIPLPAPILTKLTTQEIPHVFPYVFHATTRRAWQAILKSGFLLRMSRTHIHFSTMPVYSRKRPLILAMSTLSASLTGHINLYMSTNGVVLSPDCIPVSLLSLYRDCDYHDYHDYHDNRQHKLSNIT
jgi:RNA:NAD 2'-phosphotransferase (TPT1/KptA family)